MKQRHIVMPLAAALALAFAGGALAKLPAPSEEAKAKAEEAKAKTAHGDKVGAYKLCLSMNAVAERHVKEQKAKGKELKPTDTPACADPGPFVPPGQQAAAPAPPAAPAAPPHTAAATPAKPAAPAAAPAPGKK